MARRHPPAVCQHCGRTFRVCRFNYERQKYCGTASCTAERRRQRQRQYYRGKYRRDEAFRTAEQQRCRAGVQRRRAAARAPGAAAPRGSPPVADRGFSAAVIVGLVSQLTASNDPQTVGESVRQFAVRGQRLAVAGVWTG